MSCDKCFGLSDTQCLQCKKPNFAISYLSNKCEAICPIFHHSRFILLNFYILFL